MATSFGFFDAMKVGDDYDRKYNASNLARYFSSIVGSGVSAEIEGGYKLVPQSGMDVILNAGFAWLRGYYIEDTTATLLTFESAPSSQARIDAVALRWDKTKRTIDKVIIKGTESNTPSVPQPIRTSDIFDLIVGYVTLVAGTVAITEDLITDTRSDETYCGIIDTFASRLTPPGSISSTQLANSAVTADKIANEAVGTTKIAVGAVSQRYNVTIPSAAASWARWNGSSSNAWYTDLTVTGVKSTDRGDLFLQRGVSSGATPSLAAFEQDAENFAHIVAANITADNTLRVFADEIPANNINCYLRVVTK